MFNSIKEITKRPEEMITRPEEITKSSEEITKSPKDICSLENLDDIPKELKSQITIFRMNRFDKRIIDLFKKVNRKLNLDEVIVGYYRIYNVVSVRSKLLYRLNCICENQGPQLKKISTKGKISVFELK